MYPRSFTYTPLCSSSKGAGKFPVAVLRLPWLGPSEYSVRWLCSPEIVYKYA